MSGRPNIWPDPQPVNTPTSYRYRPAGLRDRMASSVVLVLLLALVGAALSGCAPVLHVECNADHTFCTSSIREGRL